MCVCKDYYNNQNTFDIYKILRTNKVPYVDVMQQSDMKYIKSNQGFLKLSYTPYDIISKPSNQHEVS
jgi:hypothetical protein